MLSDELIRKLDDFIRKFYRTLMLKGLFYTIILLVVFYLLLTLFEFVGYNGTVVRTVLFYLYLAFAGVIITIFVLRPLTKMWRIGKTIDYYQAAKIIGAYFPEISDKLLNLLQLNAQAENNESDLLLASIEQRTKQLSPISFNLAIDKKNLKKAGLIALSVILILILTALIFPNFIKDTTNRYIKHSTYFEKPAPFVFELQNRNLKVLQQDEIEIVVKTKGKVLPEQVEIRIDEHIFAMKKEDKNLFSYKIKHINKACSFSFIAAGYESKPYALNVVPKPVLIAVEAEVEYPKYTKLPSESLKGVNQINVPKGTTIVWSIQTKDVKSVLIGSGNKFVELKPDKKDKAFYNYKVMNDALLTIKTRNEHTEYSDSLQFQISSINDMYPQIAVIEQRDSVLPERILFRGQIKDDYGFSELSFNVLKREKDSTVLLHKENLDFTTIENVQEFYHYFDIKEYELPKGVGLEYYFEVWDNDAVSGRKSSKSKVFVLDLPTFEELEKRRDNNSEELKTETNDLLEKIKKLQQEIEEINRKLIEKKELSWQDKKQLADLSEKQKELQEKINEIKEKLHENNKLDEAMSDQEQEILEKQKELERLLDEVLDKDMKEILKEIEKLTNENIDKQKLNDALQNIKMNNQDISKQLDRNIEMYKRLEVEKKTNELIDKLNDISKEQKDLADKVKSEDKENITKEQQRLNEEFQRQREKLSQINKQMEQLDKNDALKRDKQRENEIDRLQKEAQENIDKKKRSKASENMRQASEQIQQMADDLQQQQDENEEEQIAEDIEQVRAMLKNLVRLSMQEEELIIKTKATKVSDAEYQNIIRKQYVVKEDMKMINDSLFAMSKRQPQVGNAINQELNKIATHLDKALETILRYNQVHYSNYKNTSAASSQQYAMTSMNNLALMLTESIENMKQQQQQKNNSKSKQKSQCNNPSQSNKPSKQSMSELQESLNKELERLQKELEKQNNKGQQKIGENAKLNERLAKAAAQQEMIRKMVQKAAEEAKKNGKGRPNKKLEEIQRQMEQTEKEIVNKTIGRQTINRQAKILTRMLEAEKAEKQQGKDSERKSERGKNKFNETPNGFPEFQKLKERELELFKQIPPIYSPFYKKKVNDYFYGTTIRTE